MLFSGRGVVSFLLRGMPQERSGTDQNDSGGAGDLPAKLNQPILHLMRML